MSRESGGGDESSDDEDAKSDVVANGEVEAAEEAAEEDELLDEPKFKYERVVGDVATALASNVASCIAVHDKFVCIGFADGKIRFFDPCGIEHFESRALRHDLSVTHLAVDRYGHYVISCANDGKVIVQGFGYTEYRRVRFILFHI